MDEKLKQLLLVDLCARLPYGVKVNYIKEEYGNINDLTGILDSREVYIDGAICDISDIKPYLRPMSSITEEEKRELFEIGCEGNIEYPYGIYFRCQDWLNAHHFDYRGLIEKGLALEALDEMYNINL